MKLASHLLIVALMLVSVVPAVAHHAFAGTYNLDQIATVEGTIVQFDIRNPHSFVNLEVKDSDGRVTRWGAEWGGVTLLTETGVSRQTLKAGDKVVITGPPSRDPLEHKVLMEKIRRASYGWTWGYRPNEVLPAHSLQTAK